MRAVRMACVLLAAVALPALLMAKGRTVKIVVTGGGLAEPVELTGGEVGKFNVWEGPGVAVNGVPQMKGFIADWEQGSVGERPEGRPVYELSFWVARALASLLYQTEAHDTATFAVVPVVLALISLAACALPAFRASRVEPISSLRGD